MKKHPSMSVTLSKVAACNLTKSNTHPWVFFMFFKLYKRYKIVQRITYVTRSSKWRHQLSQYIKRYFKRTFSLMQSVNFDFLPERCTPHSYSTHNTLHMEMIYVRKVDNLHYISVSKELPKILSEFN